MAIRGDNPFDPPRSEEALEPADRLPLNDELTRRDARLMGRCRSSVLFVFIVMTTFAIMSLVAFVYQSTLRMPSGELFRDTTLSWLHLLGHLVRGAGCAVLAVDLWRFHGRVGAIVAAQPDHLTPALEVLNRMWKVLAVYLGALVLYAVGSQLWILYAAGVLASQ